MKPILCDIISADDYNDNWDCCKEYVLNSYQNYSESVNDYLCTHVNEPRTISYSRNQAYMNERIMKGYEMGKQGKSIWDRKVNYGGTCLRLGFWRDLYM